MNERIKNWLGIAIIVSVLLVAFASLGLVRAFNHSIEPSAFRSFSVTGEGEAVAKPDVAQFTFSVIEEGGTNVGSLQTANTEKANAIIKFLKEQKVDEKDIKTVGYDVSPRYENAVCGVRPYMVGAAEVCPPPKIVGYTVTQTVEVKVRDFTLTGNILAGVVERGANSVSQLYFTIDDPAALENTARADAIENARAKAKTLAQAGGFKVGRLLSIDDNASPYPYYARESFNLGAADAAVKSLPAPSIEPGSQEIKANLVLRYEII